MNFHQVLLKRIEKIFLSPSLYANDFREQQTLEESYKLVKNNCTERK
jgi:hypothetical protein